MLGHLKMPFEDIKQALLSMDDEKFSEAHLKQLLLYAPDSKEVRTAAMLGETFCDVTFIARKKTNFFGAGSFESQIVFVA